MTLDTYTFSAGGFTATPFILDTSTPEAQAQSAWKLEVMVGKTVAHRNFFNDQIRGCRGECEGFCQDLHPQCTTLKQLVAARLIAADAINWEVTADDPADGVAFVGILRLSKVVLGCDAMAHYLFFDRKLKNKTPLLQEWKRWVFNPHPEINWQPLRRVTVEMPATAHALARHAQRDLGFGGPYDYRQDAKRAPVAVEGVKREGLLIDGEWVDLITMGCMSPRE